MSSENPNYSKIKVPSSDDSVDSSALFKEETRKLDRDALKEARENRWFQIEIRNQEINNDIKEDNKNTRKKYTGRLYWLIVVWLIAVIGIIIFDGLDTFKEFNISETVILALIGGTTINVLGLFVTVLKYLFKERN